MIPRLILIMATLLLPFNVAGQQPSSHNADLLFETAIKVGRLDSRRVSSIIDTLKSRASTKKDSIRIMCLQALLYYSVNKPLGLPQITRARQTARRAGIRDYNQHLLYVTGLLLKGVQKDSAFYYLTQALSAAGSVHDSVIVSESYTVLSFLEMERGNFVKAWRNLDRSQQFFFSNDYRRMVNNRTNQSHALSAIGLEERAIRVAREGIAIAKKHPYPDYEADLLSLYGNLIESSLKLNQPFDAYAYGKEARALFPGPDSLTPQFQLSLADTYLAMDSTDKALALYTLNNLDPEFKLWNFRRLHGLFRTRQRLGNRQSSRIAAQRIVQERPRLAGLQAKLEVYKVIEEAFSFLAVKDSAYHYHRLYFESYQQLYNQAQSAAILQDEFQEELKRERETAQLKALVLESKVRLNQQRAGFLIVIAVFLLIVVALLVVRYRATKKFNAMLNRKVRERTEELLEKNRQLTEYAFINAHKVRGPLARILGLTDLMSREQYASEVVHLNALVKKESESLDIIVRSITDAVRENRVFNRNDIA